MGTFASIDGEAGSRGLLVGLGYDHTSVGYPLNFSKSYPYIRGGLAIENFFVIYQHSTVEIFGRQEYFGNLKVGVNFDFWKLN